MLNCAEPSDVFLLSESTLWLGFILAFQLEHVGREHVEQGESDANYVDKSRKNCVRVAKVRKREAPNVVHDPSQEGDRKHDGQSSRLLRL